jgi:acyl-CoA thioester hydrolase
MYQHEMQIRVRYAETDQMGFVYYGNYATYYEVARVEAFRALGFPYKQMEEEGVGMPVLDMQIKYHGPAKYDDLLTIKLTIAEEPRARIVFEYEIRNETGKVINTGMTTLAFMNMQSGRPVKIPENMLNLLKPHFS